MLFVGAQTNSSRGIDDNSIKFLFFRKIMTVGKQLRFLLQVNHTRNHFLRDKKINFIAHWWLLKFFWVRCSRERNYQKIRANNPKVRMEIAFWLINWELYKCCSINNEKPPIESTALNNYWHSCWLIRNLNLWISLQFS